MAVRLQPSLLPSVLLLVCFFFIPFSSCQSDSPLNIETFYPFSIPSPENPNNTQIFPPPPSPVASLPPLPPPPAPVPVAKQDSTSNRTVAKAVVATAASTFVVSSVLFFLIRVVRRRRETGSGGTQAVGSGGGGDDEFRRFDGNVKGLIVDENGLDVLYWKRLELVDQRNSAFQKSVFHGPKGEEEKEEEIIRGGGNQRIQEIPLIRGRSSSSYSRVAPEVDDGHPITTAPPAEIAIHIPPSCPTPPSPPPVLSKSMPPPPPPVASKSMMSVPKSQSAAPPPPPPPVASKSVMSAPKNQSVAQPPPPPPPPPPVPAKKNQAPLPPPPPRAKQALVRKALQSESKVGESSSNRKGMALAGSGNDHQVKLKPLHWDKLKPNSDNSMVWDKIDNGSFR